MISLETIIKDVYIRTSEYDVYSFVRGYFTFDEKNCIGFSKSRCRTKKWAQVFTICRYLNLVENLRADYGKICIADIKWHLSLHIRLPVLNGNKRIILDLSQNMHKVFLQISCMEKGDLYCSIIIVYLTGSEREYCFLYSRLNLVHTNL